ncbi:hypothetical protein BN7_2906 [Wickerhamomyces ciferrii]|uniref:Uncharacterized protein n=1 Tax=Wickerhamomyces ciferrii (strain ATCC 14091 / BCRC 22168 / CBS 111 / JCM 3599 / NBRC 0793 / NRRL Y-1031 F-60-10) TaxID=1206466 RepID=K0KQ69_WICCF|nr:uncharacterized protein BN7_2906 [Wickerhamomyces ciferrii]CCH43358.1 hypothetical protein BN7_2906 [Wickerhamomyces ciferrii]
MSDPSSSATFKPAFFIHLEAEEPEQIYNNEAGSLTLVKVKGGYTKTLDPAYPFDTEVTFGIDNLTTSTARDGSIQNLDCQLYLKSKVNGGGIHFTYSGVVQQNEKSLAVITNQSKDLSFTDTYLTNHPKAVLSKENKEESWITGKNLLGKGRFIRNENGTLCVEYNVFVLEH